MLLRRAGAGRPAGRLVPAAAAATLAVAVLAWGRRHASTACCSPAASTGPASWSSRRRARDSLLPRRPHRDRRPPPSRRGNGQLYLATNGKPDASLSADWFRDAMPPARRRRSWPDGATQVLLPLITLAHAPGARSAAVIGQGIRDVVAPAARQPGDRESRHHRDRAADGRAGRAIFYPANRRVFDDPRSQLVIDDAKSYFAAASPPVRPHHVRALEPVGERRLGPVHHRVLRAGADATSRTTACSASGSTSTSWTTSWS